ncbi:MAG: transporter substrate-binding domain-containing protein [Thiohalocapsa sp.]|nr:transporter substrate-binding domain-containing protein [Thiohalocapsa sp.]MCF7992022.1 transporter substrate-binding domain-containing protein [Thiohalocapsa sp.]
MEFPTVLPAACLALSAMLAGTLAEPAPAVAEEGPSLRVGIAASGPPMAFFEDGVLHGLEVDLARALADRLGRELQLRQMAEPRLIDGVRGGRVDLALSTLPDSDLEALGLQASSALLETGQMALIRIDDAPHYGRPIDLMTTSARVGYQWGTAGARFVQANFPNAQRIPFPDAASAVAALRSGHLDVVVHDATTVWDVAAAPGEETVMGIFKPLTDQRLAWVVRSEDVLLARAIDAAIADWGNSGRLRELINRWIRIRVEVAP